MDAAADIARIDQRAVDAPPPAPPARYGVHSALGYGSPYGLDQHTQKIKQLGAQLSRNGVHWWAIEAQQGTYTWNSASHPLDDYVDKLTAAGIEPLLVIIGSPAWANHSDTQYDPRTDPYSARPDFYVPTDAAQFSAWVSQYQQFVRAVVRRYRDRVKLWELWNEPNLPHFWKPKPDAARYATWAAAMYQAIMQEDPTAQVAFGSVTVIDKAYGDPQISGRDFVASLIASGITPGHVSVHPYAFGNEDPDDYAPGDGVNTFRDVETMRELLVSKGLAGTEIWITEFGWEVGSTAGNPPVTVTAAMQADYLRRSLERVASSWPYVTRVAWFLDWDRPSFEGYALIHGDGTVSAAGQAFSTFVQSH